MASGVAIGPVDAPRLRRLDARLSDIQHTEFHRRVDDGALRARGS